MSDTTKTMNLENGDEKCLRHQPERRTHQFKSFLYSFFKRRRKSLRRVEDVGNNIYIDVHDPITVILFTAIIIFCVTDAIMTLFIIQYGGEEVNPFMKYLMEKDIMTFFWVKFGITSLAMLFLVSHKYFTFYHKIKGSHVIFSVFAAYLTLIVYELVLLSSQTMTS